MNTQSLNWPGIIKHAGDPELTYVSSQAEWDNDVGLHGFEYDESDWLIDSSGHVFNLSKAAAESVQPQPSGKSMTLDEILGLIKAHAALKGSCCVAKLYSPTIDEAFKIVASLDET